MLLGPNDKKVDDAFVKIEQLDFDNAYEFDFEDDAAVPNKPKFSDHKNYTKSMGASVDKVKSENDYGSFIISGITAAKKAEAGKKNGNAKSSNDIK
jgi:hypothetical protein